MYLSFWYIFFWIVTYLKYTSVKCKNKVFCIKNKLISNDSKMYNSVKQSKQKSAADHVLWREQRFQFNMACVIFFTGKTTHPPSPYWSAEFYNNKKNLTYSKQNNWLDKRTSWTMRNCTHKNSGSSWFGGLTGFFIFSH